MREIEFNSDRFLPELPEAAQSNPGAYGFELAWWLARSLQKRGIETSYPLGDDWGWFIEHERGGREMMIGCSSVADDGEGYRSQPLTWRIFIRENTGAKGWFRRTPPALPDPTEALLDAMVDLLAAEGITARRIDS